MEAIPVAREQCSAAPVIRRGKVPRWSSLCRYQPADTGSGHVSNRAITGPVERKVVCGRRQMGEAQVRGPCRRRRAHSFRSGWPGTGQGTCRILPSWASRAACETVPASSCAFVSVRSPGSPGEEVEGAGCPSGRSGQPCYSGSSCPADLAGGDSRATIRSWRAGTAGRGSPARHLVRRPAPSA